MSRRILILSCLLLTVSMGVQTSQRRSLHRAPLQVTKHALPASTSELLALGLRVKLSTLTLRELLSIPKITELRALKLLSKRDEIIKAKPGDCSAFEVVHGIGPAKALEVCRWIIPE